MCYELALARGPARIILYRKEDRFHRILLVPTCCEVSRHRPLTVASGVSTSPATFRALQAPFCAHSDISYMLTTIT